MPSAKYRTILADPPWYERGAGKIKRGADKHYSLMKTTEIVALSERVKSIAHPDSHLYLWVTNNFLPDGLLVMKAWGYRYVTVVTWAKIGNFGLGYYFRGKTEHCLFGVKGRFTRQGQGVTLLEAPRRGHSVKPVEMYAVIERVSPGPYLEMFARARRPGWDSWGNQLPEVIQELLS